MVKPISEFVPKCIRALLLDGEGKFIDRVYVGTVDDKPAWSEGRVLFIGEVPVVAETAPQHKELNFSSVAEKEGIRDLPQIFPKAFGMAGDRNVYFSDGCTIIDIRFFEAVLALDPQAQFWGDERTARGDHPVVVTHVSGERFGFVMAVRGSFPDDAKAMCADSVPHEHLPQSRHSAVRPPQAQQ